MAPVLMANGVEGPARLIYRVYLLMCHELPHRSLFSLWATGGLFASNNWLTWRASIGWRAIPGTATIAVLWAIPAWVSKSRCAKRDVAIYGAMLLTGLVFSLVRKRLRPIPHLVVCGDWRGPYGPGWWPASW